MICYVMIQLLYKFINHFQGSSEGIAIHVSSFSAIRSNPLANLSSGYLKYYPLWAPYPTVPSLLLNMYTSFITVVKLKYMLDNAKFMILMYCSVLYNVDYLGR
jgi:hypothetical protein